MLLCVFVRCAVIATLGQFVGLFIGLLFLISIAKNNVSGYTHNNTTLPKDTVPFPLNETGTSNFRSGRRLEEKCDNSTQCQEMEPFSYCVRANKTSRDWKSGTCQCNEGYTIVGDSCLHGRPIGTKCNNNTDCQRVEINSYCLMDPSSWMHLTCRCKKRYQRAGWECIPVGAYVGDECDNSQQCQQSDISSYCHDDGSPYHTCRCLSGYKYDQFYRKCFQGIALGQVCFHHAECQLVDSNSFCEKAGGSTPGRTCQCNGPIKAGKCVYVAAVMRSDQTEFSRALYIILITLGIGVPLCCAVAGITCLRKRKRHQGQIDSNLSAVPSSQASSNTYPSLPALAGTSGCEQTAEPCKPQSEEKLQFLDNPPAYEDVVRRASFLQNQSETSPPSYLQAVQCFQNMDISSSQCLNCSNNGET